MEGAGSQHGLVREVAQRFQLFEAKLRDLGRVAMVLVLVGHDKVAWANDQAISGVESEAIVRVIIALIVIVTLIIALAWGLRRYGGVGGAVSGKMKVLGSLPVGNRERVVLVKIGEEQLLLGVAPGRVQTLHVLDKPIVDEMPTASGAHASPFAARLRSMMQHHSKQ